MNPVVEFWFIFYKIIKNRVFQQVGFGIKSTHINLVKMFYKPKSHYGMKKSLLLGTSIVVLFCLPILSAKAAGTFSLTPGKIEVSLDPGASVIRNIYLTNQSGRDAHFKIEVEDVSGGAVIEEAIKFYGRSAGPYSLKNHLLINSSEITLKDGETKAVPILIKVPGGAKPGGLYGAVFFSIIPVDGPNVGPKVSTRLGTLIFLRIKGTVLESAKIKKFGLMGSGNLWSSKAARFQVAVENNGNVYTNPYGYVEIRDVFRGSLKAQIPIDPWYVFPASIRAREIVWLTPPSIGWYRATLFLNMGYDNKVGTERDSFFVFPIKKVLWLLAVAFVTFIFIWRFKSRKKRHV